MGNDLQKESNSSDAPQQKESRENLNSDERSLAAHQVPFSSCVDPPQLQHDIEGPGFIEAPDVMIPNASKESVHQPNILCFSQSSESQLTPALQEALMTMPPEATHTRTVRLIRDHAMLSPDQCIKVSETDTDDKPSQLEKIASVPLCFISTCTPPTRTSDSEHQIIEQNLEETRKTIEQAQLPSVKTDGAIGGRKEISTIEDGNDGSGTSKLGHCIMTGSSGTGKTGHSTRTGVDGSSGTGKTGHSTRTGVYGSSGTGKQDTPPELV